MNAYSKKLQKKTNKNTNENSFDITDAYINIPVFYLIMKIKILLIMKMLLKTKYY